MALTECCSLVSSFEGSGGGFGARVEAGMKGGGIGRRVNQGGPILGHYGKKGV